MTLQEILDAVMLESGMSTEPAYATADEDAVKRLVAIANRSVNTLAQYPWTALRKTHTFTLTSDTQYPLPSDWGQFIPDTMYTDSHLWPVDFPSNEGDWAYLQAATGGGGPEVRIRLIGSNLEVYEPNSGDTIRVEYVTNKPVQASDGTYKARFTADADTTLLSDELLIRDVTWRYKKLLALPDWEADLAEFRRYELIERGRESGAKTIVPDSGGFSQGPYYDLWRPVPNT